MGSWQLWVCLVYWIAIGYQCRMYDAIGCILSLLQLYYRIEVMCQGVLFSFHLTTTCSNVYSCSTQWRISIQSYISWRLWLFFKCTATACAHVKNLKWYTLSICTYIDIQNCPSFPNPYYIEYQHKKDLYVRFTKHAHPCSLYIHYEDRRSVVSSQLCSNCIHCLQPHMVTDIYHNWQSVAMNLLYYTGAANPRGARFTGQAPNPLPSTISYCVAADMVTPKQGWNGLVCSYSVVLVS